MKSTGILDKIEMGTNGSYFNTFSVAVIFDELAENFRVDILFFLTTVDSSVSQIEYHEL